jgi:hypothetical protein
MCGFMTSTSLIGNMHFVSFIDDSSHKYWIYFMKTKDEVFSKFQEFKALVGIRLSRRSKLLGFDNRGEYTFKDFDAFCREVGIKRELTMPLQITTEWGCRGVELVHHRDN